MPLYEYECPSCGVFERVQKFSDPILTTCPRCQKPVEKLLSAPAIQFKGTGWYVTDYAGKGKEKEAKGKEGAGKSGDSDKKASAKTGDDKKSSGAKTSSESGKK
ncbi:MAG: zinc ribbon domain-containing protein [Acidobacteria bacterium]|nr:zinc ribbon domain-containing protein [Acidobacteriota bacterium]